MTSGQVVTVTDGTPLSSPEITKSIFTDIRGNGDITEAFNSWRMKTQACFNREEKAEITIKVH